MARKKSKYTSGELIDKALKMIDIDKFRIDVHISEISDVISQDISGAKYRELGTVLVKCFEDSQKSNDQLIKVIAALQRNEEYDIEMVEEEEEDFDSILDKVSCDNNSNEDKD